MEMSVAEALNQAEHLFRANRLVEMERLCATILEVAPRAAEAHRFLGLSAYARGQFEEAADQARRALGIDPADAAAHDNLSLFLSALGQHVEAEAAARQALALHPKMANAAHNLGLALQAQGRFADAEPPLRQSLAVFPHNPDVWNNLAVGLEKLQRIPEAIVCLERAVQLRPDFQLAEKNLQRLRSLPLPNALMSNTANNRGLQLLSEGNRDQAEVAFRRALYMSPALPEPAFNLAKVLLLKKQFLEAEKLLRQTLEQRPNLAEVHYHVGYLYFCQNRLTEAEAAYRRCLELDPSHVQALNNLGASVLNNQGRPEEARAVYQQALALEPDTASCHSNMLFNENYVPDVTLADLAEAHAGWEARHGAPLRSTWRPYTQTANPDRPLRLGFLSGDFFLHPVGLFLAPVLRRLDREQWFTVCYANQEKNDDLTQELAALAGLWRWVPEWSDEKLADQIRADAINLLIDLSGHTGRNCLLAMARRPAPVQLTWAGYVGTTGLSAIDYLIADRFHVPIGWETHYREKVLRLPDGYVCYQPPTYAPPVGPLPARANGYVTFGSFNNTAKINRRVIALWGEILRRVPRSRLILKYHWLDDAGLRQRLTDRFAAEGIPAERLELQGTTMHSVQLQQYNRLDLALDPFPYSGGLTTLEASWMGVPVVTCPGETFASRHSLSHLSNIGMMESIAQDQADYLAKAVSLTADLPRLAELRSGLRQRMAHSPLCDLDRFVGQFTSALRGVWRDWCVTS
jgi:protein O-GlcNAc transferase